MDQHKIIRSAMEELSVDEIRGLLGAIPDPEIPVITISDLGILRNVEQVNGRIRVTITPTYSGCPAMKAIENEIAALLKEHQISDFEIAYAFSPSWTTDWLTADAKEKLRLFGIAPPEETSSDKSFILGIRKKVACPRCGSVHTEVISQFGSTACKALYRCLDCKEPFDHFKCH